MALWLLGLFLLFLILSWERTREILAAAIGVGICLSAIGAWLYLLAYLATRPAW